MNNQLKRDYAATIRNQLDRYAVWDPGAPCALGDYGVLRDKTLHKLGNINNDLGIRFCEEAGNETSYQFTSKGISLSLIGAHASGSVGPSGLAAPARSSIELQFQADQGLFISTPLSRVAKIRELRTVALELRQSGKWKYRWKFVTEVRTVNPATIIMGSAAGTSLVVSGAANLLDQFTTGALEAGAAAKVIITGQAALQIVGLKGSIFFDLCYLPRYWRDNIYQAATSVGLLSDEPYVRLGTGERVLDDEDSDDA